MGPAMGQETGTPQSSRLLADRMSALRSSLWHSEYSDDSFCLATRLQRVGWCCDSPYEEVIQNVRPCNCHGAVLALRLLEDPF